MVDAILMGKVDQRVREALGPLAAQAIDQFFAGYPLILVGDFKQLK